MRYSTEDIYQKSVNRVIDYINARLHTPLPLDRIAGFIHVSRRQLLRIMRTSLHEPLSAYIARQRIERAVMYMQTEDLTLTELAERVGYDNSQSFSKAFKKHFGLPPKVYVKELKTRLESLVKCSSGAQNHLQPEICSEQETDLIYIRIIGEYGETELYAAAWNKLMDFLRINRELSDATRFIGISFDDPYVTKRHLLRFYACGSVTKPFVPTGEFGVLKIPAGRYAVYTLKGSYSGLQELYSRIWIDFPCELRHGVAFEEYLNSPHNMIEDDLLTKIFIPIK
jgi:AraC-like DNA-binding protein/predicted transcriptional regulator YdeE